MYKGHVARLERQISLGEVILFTGAGFSMSAFSTAGQTIPGSDQLRHLIWDVAYPGKPLDTSSLADTFDSGVRRAKGAVGKVMKEHLTVRPGDIPEIYKVWFSMPWFRIYTLNVDNLADAVSVKFNLPRAIRSVSALTDSVPASDELICVHLNGRVQDYPDLTFSERQYGHRVAYPDVWYSQLVAELTGHPVVFVGTQLDEPPLWQQLELRQGRVRGSRERRPASLLVSPSLSLARQEVLEDFNIDWVDVRQEEFATTVLEPMHTAREAGLRTITRRAALSSTESSVRLVSELRTEATTEDPTEFLMGREPTWSDVVDGFAVLRDFEGALSADIAKSGSRLVVLTGTTGTGKSTTLMRLALLHQGEGRKTYWVDRESPLSAWDLRTMARRLEPDILVIDDLDRFGSAANGLLQGILQDSPNLRVITAVRSSNYDRLAIADVIAECGGRSSTIPHLEDADISLLLDALEGANRLGRLRGKTRDHQIKVFRDLCGRQLLVAMIEATSGQRFDEKIDRECTELGPELGSIYATVSVATLWRYRIPRDELLLALGDVNNEQLGKVNSLVERRLLLEADGTFRLRHRVIAEKVVDHYLQEHQLFDPLSGLTFAMATRSGGRRQRGSRQTEFLIKLTNHDWLMRMLRLNEVRSVFASVQQLMAHDFHYWLQRGSFEVEKGTLDLARNFLDQAHELAPGDHRVKTEWAYMMMKSATRAPDETSSRADFDAALGELESAIEGRGHNDPYPFHVLASQGLAWISRANMGDVDRARLLDRIRSHIEDGCRLHPRDRELEQLSKDVTKRYILATSALPESERRQGMRPVRIGAPPRDKGGRPR